MNILSQSVMKSEGKIRVNKMVNSINDFTNKSIEDKIRLVQRVEDREFSDKLTFINQEEKIKYYLCLEEVRNALRAI